jgi:hypothetical protein
MHVSVVRVYHVDAQCIPSLVVVDALSRHAGARVAGQRVGDSSKDVGHCPANVDWGLRQPKDIPGEFLQESPTVPAVNRPA